MQDQQRSLSQLQRELNRCMRCPAGQNQVYILSRMRSNGRLLKESPRVALDCKIRSYLGWHKKVYEEGIRKVCCNDFERACEAYSTFMVRTRRNFMVV